MKIKFLLFLLLFLVVGCGFVSAADTNDSSVSILQEYSVESTSTQISNANMIMGDDNSKNEINTKKRCEYIGWGCSIVKSFGSYFN